MSEDPGEYRSEDPGEDEGEWLSTDEAARLLGINKRTLYRLIDGGDLVAYKIGRVIRVRRSDLDGFLAAQRIQPGDLAHLYPATGDD